MEHVDERTEDSGHEKHTLASCSSQSHSIIKYWIVFFRYVRLTPWSVYANRHGGWFVVAHSRESRNFIS